MALTDIELARFFLVLKLHNEDFNTDFLMSVVTAETPSEKQLAGLKKCVDGLKLKEKIERFDTDEFVPYFNDEVDFDNVTTNEVLYCAETGQSVESDEMLIFNTHINRFYSVDAYKKNFRYSKPTKKKLVLSAL